MRVGTRVGHNQLRAAKTKIQIGACWVKREEDVRTLTSRIFACCAAAFIGVAFMAASAATNDAYAGWEPNKPVEFIIMAGKGGGADKMARLMQAVIEKNGWSSKPLTPINKPGGSGAEALVHLQQARDPNHVIMVTLNSFYTTPMRQPKLGVDISKFTPVARMAEDTFLLWVHKDSGIKNVNDFVAAAKSAGNNWSWQVPANSRKTSF